MSDLIQQIASDLQKQIERFEQKVSVRESGIVLEVGKDVVRVQGLANVKARELGQFENGVMGMALPLLHKLDALRADFHSIDTCCGREWVRQALQ